MSVIAGTATPLTIAALTSGLDDWGALTLPLVTFWVLAAVVTLLVRWDDRPWATRR